MHSSRFQISFLRSGPGWQWDDEPWEPMDLWEIDVVSRLVFFNNWEVSTQIHVCSWHESMLALFVVFSSRFSGNKHITKHMPCHVVSAGGGFWSMQSCSWTVLNLYKQHPQSSMSRPTVQIGRWVWQFAQFPRRSPFWLPIKTTDINGQFVGV